MYTGYRTERRKFKRLRVNLSVLCRVMAPYAMITLTQGEEFEAKTADLSEGGMALVTDKCLPLGTELFCKFVIYENDTLGSVKFYQILTVFSQVRSIISIDGVLYRVGLCFEELDADKKEKVKDIIECPLRYEPRAVLPSHWS